MTLAIVESLRKIANAQLKVAPSLSNTLGATVAHEMTMAYQELLAALDNEPIEEKSTSIFGDRVFKSKKKKKTA